MKIFSFNPVSGKRGAFIEERKLATYTDCSVRHAVQQGDIEPIICRPIQARSNEEWMLHVDAGIMEQSYLGDQWICFCLGEWNPSQGEEGIWSWVVLPPRSMIIKANPAFANMVTTKVLKEQQV